MRHAAGTVKVSGGNGLVAVTGFMLRNLQEQLKDIIGNRLRALNKPASRCMNICPPWNGSIHISVCFNDWNTRRITSRCRCPESVIVTAIYNAAMYKMISMIYIVGIVEHTHFSTERVHLQTKTSNLGTEVVNSVESCAWWNTKWPETAGQISTLALSSGKVKTIRHRRNLEYIALWFELL